MFVVDVRVRGVDDHERNEEDETADCDDEVVKADSGEGDEAAEGSNRDIVECTDNGNQKVDGIHLEGLRRRKYRNW